LFAVALLVHGALGAVDTLVFHEGVARLRRDPGRHRRELVLHGVRSVSYAGVFGAAAAGHAAVRGGRASRPTWPCGSVMM
jgi:hypothetical protein